MGLMDALGPPFHIAVIYRYADGTRAREGTYTPGGYSTNKPPTALAAALKMARSPYRYTDEDGARNIIAMELVDDTVIQSFRTMNDYDALMAATPLVVVPVIPQPDAKDDICTGKCDCDEHYTDNIPLILGTPVIQDAK